MEHFQFSPSVRKDLENIEDSQEGQEKEEKEMERKIAYNVCTRTEPSKFDA